ncbi:MAG: hypothetical protein ACE5Q6_24060, partial [Dehalococcoidia bacterium]
MPEYLAPGVYVEEVSFRSKSIEGVSTSTTGFVGPTRFGPINGEPELLTNFNQFERIFGGLDRLIFRPGGDFTEPLDPMHNFMAHAVRAYFDNGGRRLYAARTFRSFDDVNQTPGVNVAIPADLNGDGVATSSVPAPALAIREAERAAAAGVTAANAAITAANDSARGVQAAMLRALEASVAHFNASLPAGTTLPAIDLAATTAADLLTAMTAVISGLDAGDQPAAQAAHDAVEPVVNAAVAARDAAAAVDTDATQAAVRAAIDNGRGAGDAIPVANLPAVVDANATAVG